MAHPIDRCRDLLSSERRSGGYLIATGGTAGNPSYCYYTHAEARRACRSIAHNFMSNGLARGDIVVNYFLPGGMWSSFLTVDRALSALPVTVLPVGFSPDRAFALEVIQRFRPNTIAGIASTLVELARECQISGLQVQIEKVFFAGEMMTDASASVLETVWSSRMIRSAGYATTDFGPIGWQCEGCGRDDYHVCSDVVLEIVDEEIVVTSLTRRAMPLIRYRTGDLGCWLRAGACAVGAGCGASFRLMGRADCRFQLMGCTLCLDDVLRALEECGVAQGLVQVCMRGSQSEEMVSVRVEPALGAQTASRVRDAIFRRCSGPAGGIERHKLDACLLFEETAAGSFERHPRTGKVIPIVDRRSSR